MSSAAHHASESESLLVRADHMAAEDPEKANTLTTALVHSNLAQAYALNDLVTATRFARRGQAE